MIAHAHLKKYLEHLPLIALAVITAVGFFGVYYLWAHPAGQGTPVDVGSGPIQNRYYYLNGALPDLDNCPGGPNAQPCYDEFGVQISCYNPDQNDGDFDLQGDICDPDTAIGPPPSTCIDSDHDNYGNPGSPGCSSGPEEDCDDEEQSINPGAPENCANPAADNNCNSLKGCNDTSPNGCPSCTGGRICATSGLDINTCVFPPETCNDAARVDEDGDGKANCADDQCHNQLGENGKLCCGLLSGASVVPDDSICGACKTCSAGSLECNNQTDGPTGNSCNTQCTQCAGGACVPYGLGNAGECPVGKVCNGAIPPICADKPEDCTNGVSDDVDGLVDCADSECFGQIGPDPDGAGPLPAGKCCFNQGVVPPALDVNQCGTCEACVGSPTYQCRAQTAENANLCVGACTACSAAQPLVCVNRPAGDIGDPSGPCTGMGLCDGLGSCTTSCGNGVFNNPPEFCDPTAPQQGLPGETTGPGANYRSFQETDQCLSCGAVGSAGECVTLRYLNCADGTINDDDFIPLPIKPTKYLWTTGWNGGSQASVSQIVALPNAIPKPGGGFYGIGEIVHEYRICDKGSGVASARYYAVDIITGGDCNAGDSEVIFPRHVAVNNDDANNTEAWVTFSSGNLNYHGVALFSEQAGLIKFCRSRDADDDGLNDAGYGPFYPYGVAVDRQGNAWVGGGAASFAPPSDTAILRKYGRSSASGCAMIAEISRSGSNWGALSWLMTIAPNGDLWSTTHQNGLVAYVGQPDSPNPTILSNVAEPSSTNLQPYGIISDRNGNAIVATNSSWSPIRRYKNAGGVLTHDDLPTGNFQLQAVSFDIYKASQTPRSSYLWSSQYTGAIRIFDRNGSLVHGPQSLSTNSPFTLALASDGYVWTTFSNSRQVCQYDFIPATPIIINPPACYPGVTSVNTADLTGGDFTGGHRSLIFGEEVGYLPRLSDAPLTAFDAIAPNGSWNHRWGKVVYQQVSTFGTARVYVCLSDAAADLNGSCGGSATGWVLAADYNSDYTNIIYRKKYLRLKVIKNVGVQIQGLKVGCLDGSGNVCN